MKTPALARHAVDRDAATRLDQAALDQAWLGAKVLVVDGQGRALVDGTDLVFLPSTDAPAGERLYLGRDASDTYFAVPAELPRTLGARALGLREVGAVLPDRDAGLLVHAVGLVNWHVAHPCCARCGAATRISQGGAIRVCDADASQHFPRTDPAVIVLVTDGQDRCVLGRQSTWPPGRYSTLAGFVEPGESAEEAVVREVAEESGLAVRDVAYRASQPWPFPSSLMLGFRAVCDGEACPRISDAELEDVRWFSRAELLAGAVALPSEVSIAHALIAEWLAEG